MAREKLLEGQNPRLAKIILEVTVPIAYNDLRIIKDRLRDFMLGPSMPGWQDPNCFQLRIEESADALQVQKCE